MSDYRLDPKKFKAGLQRIAKELGKSHRAYVAELDRQCKFFRPAPERCVTVLDLLPGAPLIAAERLVHMQSCDYCRGFLRGALIISLDQTVEHDRDLVQTLFARVAENNGHTPEYWVKPFYACHPDRHEKDQLTEYEVLCFRYIPEVRQKHAELNNCVFCYTIMAMLRKINVAEII